MASKCKKCSSGYAGEWRASNLESARKSGREHQARLRAADPEAARARSRESMRKWHAENPDGVRRRDLRAKYNITPEEFDEKLAEQGGCAARCGRQGSRWVQDHNHDCCPGEKTCGECLRGILCNECNLTLGLAGDSADTLRLLADYLDGWMNP